MSQKRRAPADEPWLLVRTFASSLRAGENVPPHAHDWHQLVYAAQGVLNVWTDSGSWIVPPHWAVWVPAGTRHGFRAAEPSLLRTLYLRPGSGERLPEHCTVVTVSPLLRALILKAVEFGMLDERDPVEAATATLIVEEFRAAGTPSFALPQPASAAMRRAAALLSEQPLTISELARATGSSVRTLERRFRAETGMSPAQWRRQQVLLRALERLAGGVAIKRVAADAGYASASAFVAAFRSQFGVTPGRYFAQQ
jgi:AraC-like DNA-binding protein